jgi:hypothetical protein
MNSSRSKRFICGCCGRAFFSTDEVQAPFDQDSGYGFCAPCALENEQRNEDEWNKLEKLVADSLNETNRAKFLSYDLELRRGLMLQMMDDGVITWTIRRVP